MNSSRKFPCCWNADCPPYLLSLLFPVFFSHSYFSCSFFPQSPTYSCFFLLFEEVISHWSETGCLWSIPKPKTLEQCNRANKINPFVMHLIFKCLKITTNGNLQLQNKNVSYLLTDTQSLGPVDFAYMQNSSLCHSAPYIGP